MKNLDAFAHFAMVRLNSSGDVPCLVVANA